MINFVRHYFECFDLAMTSAIEIDGSLTVKHDQVVGLMRVHIPGLPDIVNRAWRNRAAFMKNPVNCIDVRNHFQRIEVE